MATLGIERTGLDTTTFASFNYEVATFEVTEAAPNAYPTLAEGLRPTFYVWRPMDVDEDEELPMVLFHHGGAIGDDSLSTPYPCDVANIEIWLRGHRQGSLSLPWIIAARRWALVIPRNDWCDAWQGLGPDDPVDPEHHFGHVHEARAKAFVEAGGAGFRVKNDEKYMWGTSAGGGTILSSAARFGDIQSVVWDSGFSSFFLYYQLPGSDGLPATSELEHIFGGPPFTEDGQPNGEIYDRYAASSATTLLETGGFSPRALAGWNRLDVQVDPLHGAEMTTALALSKSPANAADHDFNRPFPGLEYHVQTVLKTPPQGYYTYAIAEFLAGADLIVTEAESACEAVVCIGKVGTEADDVEFGHASGAAARVAEVGEIGVLVSDPLPSTVAPGAIVRAAAAFWLGESDEVDVDAELATLIVYDGAAEIARTAIFGRSLYHPNSAQPEVSLMTQYEQTWVSFVAVHPTEMRVELRVSGAADVRVDSVLWLVGP